ncbi:MAG: gluconate 2-dehydrogenase subunit 3 family protein [Acetobacteraceae bacterium]|nr:gluconate 2-dehydrogenase subunit 3 family protein [Acetobacteraceae bacterium]MBV8524021.1 gluconate 2-dehydrogenase subunit 3 family protein [Acetobacteraceae bacterium]
MNNRGPRYPGYNVLDKRDTPSWNEITRKVIDHRLTLDGPKFFTLEEWLTLRALCDCIVPQRSGRAPVQCAALVDHKMELDQRDGFRPPSLPSQREAWRRGIAAINEECRERYGGAFHELTGGQQDRLLRLLEEGEASSPAWGDMPAKVFFKRRLVHDIAAAYYALPHAWNEMGFGGPASPRGYVRLDFNKRDRWEAIEQHD